VYLRVGIAEGDETKLGGRVNNEIFRHPAHVDHSQTGPLKPLYNEITVGNGVHRVFADGFERQFLPKELTVETVRVSGERSRAERKNGNSGVELTETLQIREERLGVGQEQVRPPDGLSALRVSGHISRG